MHPLRASSRVAEKLPAPLSGRAVRTMETQPFEIVNVCDDNSYDEVLRLAADVCSAPAAMLCFVHQGRQWIAAHLGIDALDCPQAVSFCAQALHAPQRMLVVPDPAEDGRFSIHKGRTGGNRFRFYASAPLLTPLGSLLGMICVMDRRRRGLSAAQSANLESVARQIVRQLTLGQENIALRRANARLAEISMTDALTGIANRRAFDERLAVEVSQSRRAGAVLSLLLMDVDQFKDFNDRHGHLAGDEALSRIASTLKGNNRATDLLARYGGEEFALILPQTRAEAAAAVAERHRRAVEAIEMPWQRITLSIGIATYDPSHSSDELIAAADRALYAAKAIGRNRVVMAVEQDV